MAHFKVQGSKVPFFEKSLLIHANFTWELFLNLFKNIDTKNISKILKHAGYFRLLIVLEVALTLVGSNDSAKCAIQMLVRPNREQCVLKEIIFN